MPDPTGRVSHLPDMHRGFSWKPACRVATTANVTIATALNAGDTIDGVVLVAGDRVLVKDQTTGSQNGIYIAGVTPARAHDMDQDATTSVPAEEVLGAIVQVYAGTANGGTMWRTTNTSAPTLGSTTITWAEVDFGSSDAILRYGGGAEWYDAHGGAAVGATETIDLANGNVHRVILDVNCTLTFTGAVASIDGQAVASGFLLFVEQDGSGGNTVTWPASVVWPDGVAPTLDTTGGAVEILAFTTTDGGTVWHGVHSGSGGDGTPATTVESETTFGITPAVGTDTEYARQDHTHGSPTNPVSAAAVAALGFVGPILISDSPSTPLVFADLIQNEAEDDLVYADL